MAIEELHICRDIIHAFILRIEWKLLPWVWRPPSGAAYVEQSSRGIFEIVEWSEPHYYGHMSWLDTYLVERLAEPALVTVYLYSPFFRRQHTPVWFSETVMRQWQSRSVWLEFWTYQERREEHDFQAWFHRAPTLLFLFFIHTYLHVNLLHVGTCTRVQLCDPCERCSCEFYSVHLFRKLCRRYGFN